MARRLLLLALIVFAWVGGAVGASPRGAHPQPQTLSDRYRLIHGRLVTSDGMPIYRGRLDVQGTNSTGVLGGRQRAYDGGSRAMTFHRRAAKRSTDVRAFFYAEV